MRRILSIILALMLLLGMAIAQGETSARAIALEMAGYIAEMQDIKAAPLEDAPNRATWLDVRTDAKCALIVFADDAAAQDAALDRATRHTAVRRVDCCLLEIDSDLAPEAIDLYHRALADALGVEITEEAPGYILNASTKKFHDPSCASVGVMRENNKHSYTGDRDTLLQHGYKPCQRCKP